MEGGERERKDVALYSESGSGSVAGIVNVLSVLCSCTSSVRTERENLGCVHLSQGLEHATAWMRPIRIIDAGPSIRYTSVSCLPSVLRVCECGGAWRRGRSGEWGERELYGWDLRRTESYSASAKYEQNNPVSLVSHFSHISDAIPCHACTALRCFGVLHVQTNTPRTRTLTLSGHKPLLRLLVSLCLHDIHSQSTSMNTMTRHRPTTARCFRLHRPSILLLPERAADAAFGSRPAAQRSCVCLCHGAFPDSSSTRVTLVGTQAALHLTIKGQRTVNDESHYSP